MSAAQISRILMIHPGKPPTCRTVWKCLVKMRAVAGIIRGRHGIANVFKSPRRTPAEASIVYFEAVMGKCVVWVNGRQVAEHFGGYLPFAADITDRIRSGGEENVIAVRADNSDDPTYPPGKPQNDLDFTYLGGIYRDAYLIETSPVHVTLPELSQTTSGGGVFIGVKDVNGSDTSLEVRTEIVNESAAAQKITLRTALETAGGRGVRALRNRSISPPACSGGDPTA